MADAGAEAQAVCAKEMNVYVPRPAVSLKLKVMMLKVVQAVAHLHFTGSKRA